MKWDDYYKTMLALTMWREARGEGVTGMLAVGLVIRNRVQAGQGDWDHVITKKWQFSSLTAPGDPMLVQWPDSPDQVFEDAMQLAERIYSDPELNDITQGATLYFNPNVVTPKWDFSKLQNVAAIGRHVFYREVA